MIMSASQFLATDVVFVGIGIIAGSILYNEVSMGGGGGA